MLMARIERWLIPLSKRLYPRLTVKSGATRLYSTAIFATAIYTMPLAAAGMVWLVLSTDLGVLADNWQLVIILFVLDLVFHRLLIFNTIELSPGTYSTASTTIDVLLLSAALLLGPSILWIDLASMLLGWLYEVVRDRSRELWHNLNEVFLETSVKTIPILSGLALYTALGGTYPIAGFTSPGIVDGLLATLLAVLLSLLIFTPMLAMYTSITRTIIPGIPRVYLLTRMLSLWLGINILINPTAVFIAALYEHSGQWIYLFFIASILAGALAGSRLSFEAERSRQRSRELAQLEQFGRAIIAAPLDGAALPDLLATFVPGMFANCRVAVHLFPDQDIVQSPHEWVGISSEAWTWLQNNPHEHHFKAGAPCPWSEDSTENHNTLMVPIIEVDGERMLGGIYIGRPVSQGKSHDLVPAVQTLASQVASAIRNAESYRETLSHQSTQHELTVAGQIQSTFLPNQVPDLDGWEISAMLEAARETSGDFFDLIPLWDGRLGVVIADVADKGLGAALYMALCRTLLRTYATEYSTRYPENYAYHPERVLTTVNQSILQDTQSELFVTIFYCIIDPQISSITYASAGHNPPLLFTRENEDSEFELRKLRRTGIPVGVLQNHTWDRGSVQMNTGDVLVLYTDGLIDAENDDREFFGEQRLIEAIAPYLDSPAGEIRQAVTDVVQEFTGSRPKFDDITLLVIRRVE